jgi:hypothetical protein
MECIKEKRPASHERYTKKTTSRIQGVAMAYGARQKTTKGVEGVKGPPNNVRDAFSRWPLPLNFCLWSRAPLGSLPAHEWPKAKGVFVVDFKKTEEERSQSIFFSLYFPSSALFCLLSLNQEEKYNKEARSGRTHPHRHVGEESRAKKYTQAR